MKDMKQERVRLDRKRIGQLTLEQGLRASVGHLYLLRIIQWEDADMVVAFQILKRDSDGSVTLAWKKLADFPKPFVLFMPDDELQQQIDAIIAEENITGYKVVVKDNWLYTLGPVHYSDKFQKALYKRQVRYRGAGGMLP
jgi:hypothetical protein